MTLDGADLVNKNQREGIKSPTYKKCGDALEIMNKVKDKGGWFGVCPPCAGYPGPRAATNMTEWNWPGEVGS